MTFVLSVAAYITFFEILLQIPSDKLVKLLNILEKNILDGSKLSTMMNHVSPSFFG